MAFVNFLRVLPIGQLSGGGARRNKRRHHGKVISRELCAIDFEAKRFWRCWKILSDFIGFYHGSSLLESLSVRKPSDTFYSTSYLFSSGRLIDSKSSVTVASWLTTQRSGWGSAFKSLRHLDRQLNEIKQIVNISNVKKRRLSLRCYKLLACSCASVSLWVILSRWFTSVASRLLAQQNANFWALRILSSTWIDFEAPKGSKGRCLTFKTPKTLGKRREKLH